MQALPHPLADRLAELARAAWADGFAVGLSWGLLAGSLLLILCLMLRR